MITNRETILVVNDKPDVAALTVCMLQQAGYDVASADSGHSALEYVKQFKPNLVLMDCALTDIERAEVCRRVKSAPESAETLVVIVVNSRTQTGDEAAALESGADGCIVRHVSSRDFVARIEALLRIQRRMRSAHAAGEVDVMRHSDKADPHGDVLVDSLPPEHQSVLVIDPQTDSANFKPGPALRGKRILVVEDNDINQQIAMEVLRMAGCEVTVVENGNEALIALNAAENADFAAVLMDVRMPGLDGFATTQLIRLNERFERLPIVALTADVDSGIREECLAAGMNDYLTKPIDSNLLYATLKKWTSPASDTISNADA